MGQILAQQMKISTFLRMLGKEATAIGIKTDLLCILPKILSYFLAYSAFLHPVTTQYVLMYFDLTCICIESFSIVLWSNIIALNIFYIVGLVLIFLCNGHLDLKPSCRHAFYGLHSSYYILGIHMPCNLFLGIIYVI